MSGEHFSGGPMPHEPIRRLDNELYANVERNIVYGCTDVAIRNPQTGEIFLGDRQTEPQVGPWFVGGRDEYSKGISENAALQVKNDLGLELDENRFKHVATYSTDFPIASPTNVDHGRHTQNAVMLVDLTPEEVKELNHKVASGEIRDEYSHGEWHNPSEIVDSDSDYAYVLKQFVVDLYEYDLLREAIWEDAHDEYEVREQMAEEERREQEAQERIQALKLLYGLTKTQATELERVADTNAAYCIAWVRSVTFEHGLDETLTKLQDILADKQLGDVQITRALQEYGARTPHVRSDNGPVLRAILEGSVLAIEYNQESDGKVFAKSEALEALIRH